MKKKTYIYIYNPRGPLCVIYIPTHSIAGPRTTPIAKPANLVPPISTYLVYFTIQSQNGFSTTARLPRPGHIRRYTARHRNILKYRLLRQ